MRIEIIMEFVFLCVFVKKWIKKFFKDYEIWGIELKFLEIV